MSQYNISSWIYNLFGQKPGIFLEAGGSFPDDQSNTKFLEDNGWRGMCVEPLTSYNEAYKKIRPNTILENYALVDKDYKDETILAGIDYHGSGVLPHHTNGTLPNIKGTQHWPACPLEKLLKKHNLTQVDFFSLDTEGYEHNVLGGIDYNYTFFNVIVIEDHGKENYEWAGKTNDFSYLNDVGYIFRGFYPHPEAHHQIYTHKDFDYK